MTRILVNPDQLHTMSAKLHRASQELHVIESRMSSAYGRLDAEARAISGVGARVRRACAQAQALSDQADAMARFLEHTAQKFTDADRQSAVDLGQIVGPFAGVLHAILQGSAGVLLTLPNIEVLRLTQLGQVAAADMARPPSVIMIAPAVVKQLAAPVSAQQVGKLWVEQKRRLDDQIAALEQRVPDPNDLRTEPVSRQIEDIDRQIADLEAQKSEAVAHADDWWNKVLPNGLGRDGDGVPWRTQSDKYRDQIAEIDRKLQDLHAQKDKLLDQKNTLDLLLVRLNEREQLYGLFDPYLAPPVDNQGRQALVASLPTDMRKNIFSSARTIHDAPIQIPAANLDRNSYTALVNQFVSSPQNPRYAQLANGQTFCDVFVRDVLAATGTSVKEFGSIDAITNDLQGRTEHWEPVSAEEAQRRANQGIPALVLMKDPDGLDKGTAGHGAVVVPSSSDFDSKRGPQIAQAGAGIYMIDDRKYARDGFGSNLDVKDRVIYMAYKP
jgi:hypothetical protein